MAEVAKKHRRWPRTTARVGDQRNSDPAAFPSNSRPLVCRRGRTLNNGTDSCRPAYLKA
jgi:hypothetical protein